MEVFGSMNSNIIVNLTFNKALDEEFNLFVEYFYSKINNSLVSHLYIDKQLIKIFALSGELIECLEFNNKNEIFMFLKGFKYNQTIGL